MRFNCGADLGPTRGIDPDTAILYGELCSGWIFRKVGRARFPFFAASACNQFSETRGDERRCVGLTIGLHRRVQEFRYAAQNVDSAIFSVAAQTNYCGNVEIEFPKRLRQTVRGPVLLLARNARAGTKITNQTRLGQDDSCRAIYF